jgi:adiponectin receptor
VMGMTYIMGAIFYMTKFPERLYPGKFDLLGNSHQIFHIFVIMAALIYYFSMKYIADARLNHHFKDLLLFEAIKEH